MLKVFHVYQGLLYIVTMDVSQSFPLNSSASHSWTSVLLQHQWLAHFLAVVVPLSFLCSPPPPPPPPILSKKRFLSLFYRQLQVQIKMLLQCSENPKCAPAGPLEVQMLPIKYFLQLSMKNQFAGKFNNTMYLEAKFVSCCWLLSSDAAQGKIACGKERKTGEIPTLITSMGLDAMAPARPARKLALQKNSQETMAVCQRGKLNKHMPCWPAQSGIPPNFPPHFKAGVYTDLLHTLATKLASAPHHPYLASKSNLALETCRWCLSCFYAFAHTVGGWTQNHPVHLVFRRALVSHHGSRTNQHQHPWHVGVISLFFCFVFLSFDDSDTLIKIKINRVLEFCLYPTNGFSPHVLRFSHSSPGLFGTGSLLPFPPSPLFFFNPLVHIPKLSSPPSPHLSVTLLYHLSLMSYTIHYTPITCQHSSKHWTWTQHSSTQTG